MLRTKRWRKARQLQKDELKGQDLYVSLLARLADLCYSSGSSRMGEEMDKDRWGATVVKAFTLLHEDGNYDTFLRHHAFEGTPYLSEARERSER